MRLPILSVATVLSLTLSSSLYAQTAPHTLRAPDGTLATLATSPAATSAAPAAPMQAAPTQAAPMPTMTISTVADLQNLCAKADTADQLNSCLNVLSKAVDTIRATEAQRGSRYVCNGERLLNVKVRQVFLSWIQSNPGFASEDANRGVLTALSTAYPCANGNVIAPAGAPVVPAAALPANTVVPAAAAPAAPAATPAYSYPANPMTGY